MEDYFAMEVRGSAAELKHGCFLTVVIGFMMLAGLVL
jgi:hypothetical protein